MAKRRLARALAGLGEGLGSFGTMKLRQSMQDASQDRYDDRQEKMLAGQAGRQAEAERLRIKREVALKVASGELDPEQALALIGPDADEGEINAMRPSPRRRMEKGIGSKIDSASSLTDLPTDETIRSTGRREGLYDEEFAGPMPEGEEAFAGFDQSVIDTGRQAGARRKSFMDAPTETVTGKDPQTGAPFTSKKSLSDLQTPFTTGPTAQQEGVLEGAKKVAADTAVLGNDALTELRGRSEARIQNMVENLTRGARVATAAATAGASKRASLAPDIVASEVERGKALAAGKENSTEGERRAATNFTPLINAHAQALAQEAKGAKIGTGDQTMTNLPLLNRMVPAQTQQYMQSARDFVSTLGLIRSGVAVPEAEVTRFMSSMFGTTGDTPKTLQNKQATREVFIASLQAMVGRSGDDAGRLMAEAINGGQIPMSILSMMKFEPQIESALLSNLKGVPVFDGNGRPITAQKPK